MKKLIILGLFIFLCSFQIKKNTVFMFYEAHQFGAEANKKMFSLAQKINGDLVIYDEGPALESGEFYVCSHNVRIVSEPFNLKRRKDSFYLKYVDSLRKENAEKFFPWLLENMQNIHLDDQTPIWQIEGMASLKDKFQKQFSSTNIFIEEQKAVMLDIDFENYFLRNFFLGNAENACFNVGAGHRRIQWILRNRGYQVVEIYTPEDVILKKQSVFTSILSYLVAPYGTFEKM